MDYVLDLRQTWCIKGITDPEQFFLALKWFIVPDVILHLEVAGSTIRHVREYLAKAGIKRQLGIKIGSISPAAYRIYQVRISEQLLSDLAFYSSKGELAVDHLCLFRNTDVLLEYSDAFMRASFVCIAKVFPLDMVRGFSQQLEVPYIDGTEAFPED